jgi:hypothetical protein
MPPTTEQTKENTTPSHGAPISKETEKVLEELLQASSEGAETLVISASPEGKPVIQHTKNLYPIVRHSILIICVVLCALVIIFLMIQNGKSIYDNGI